MFLIRIDGREVGIFKRYKEGKKVSFGFSLVLEMVIIFMNFFVFGFGD